MYDPLAYTYEADVHCPDCAEERFGRGGTVDGGPGFIAEGSHDSEGNEVGAIFVWDSWHQDSSQCETLSCSDCHMELDRVHCESCNEVGGSGTCTLLMEVGN